MELRYEEISEEEYQKEIEHKKYFNWLNFRVAYREIDKNPLKWFMKTSLKYWKMKLGLRNMNGSHIYRVLNNKGELGFLVLSERGVSFVTGSEENLLEFLQEWY